MHRADQLDDLRDNVRTGVRRALANTTDTGLHFCSDPTRAMELAQQIWADG
jgi:hypothetical protein